MPAVPQGGVRYFRKWLFDVPTTEDNLSLGMVRDVERWAIPAGGSYQLTDFMVDDPGRLYKRGGTAYQSSSLTASGGSTSTPVGVVAAEYPGDPRILALVSNGAAGRSLFDVSAASHGSELTLAVQPYENPPTFTDGSGTYVVVCDSQNAAVVPRKVTLVAGVVTVAAMSGSPPAATVSASHPPYFVLANTTAHPNRIFFSPRGIFDSQTWQVTGVNASWLDIDEPVMAMTSFGGALLVWTRHKLLRITGDYAPGDENFNMGLQPVAQVGCIDARTVVKGSQGVYFANENGVYITDGASVESLTEKSDGSGISFMWRNEIMAGFYPKLFHVVCSGLYQDMYLFISIIRVGSPDRTFLCFLPTKSWIELGAGMAADMFATSLAGPNTPAISNDIYLAQPFGTGGNTCRIVKAAGIFIPTVTNKNDADGTAVLPTWTTRAFTHGSMNLKRHGFGHLSYQMNSVDSPTMTIVQATGLEATGGFTAVKEGTPLQKTNTGVKRKRFKIYKDAQGISFRFAQTAASEQTEIYSLEMEAGTFFQGEGQ